MLLASFSFITWSKVLKFDVLHQTVVTHNLNEAILQSFQFLARFATKAVGVLRQNLRSYAFEC